MLGPPFFIMAPRRNHHPTAAELEILHVVWENDACTVRAVFDALNAQRKVGYTTILKLMQIMHEKGLLDRDDSERSHRYEAAVDREETQQEIVATLIQKVFGGSAAQLVKIALGQARASKVEMARIRALFEPKKNTATKKK
jgi:BlaI family transcriptional regulator, penicillinase repressor